MYSCLREVYWWEGMKKDIVEFVSKMFNFLASEGRAQKIGGLSQNIEIPKWKWDMINMDLITGLPRSRNQHDCIWVIVDRMKKSAHFLLGQDYLFGGGLCQVVPSGSGKTSWSSDHYYF